MRRQTLITQKRGRVDPFSLSFLDIISCGFGAVVVLILIFQFDPFQNKTPAVTSKQGTKASLANILAEADLIEQLAQARTDLDTLATDKTVQQDFSKTLQHDLTNLQKQLADSSVINNDLKRELTVLNKRLKLLKVAGNRANKPIELDEEVGGLIVDRDYVVFIVDTSGSMREIWGRVANQITQLIEQHPRVKGIQIINDNGTYLFSGYAKSWIPDTPKMRQRILQFFELWSSASNSSPVEGLIRALNDFQSFTPNMSIYVLGDDFSGADFDGAIKKIQSLNQGRARINAINFISPNASTDRFSILMREIALDNNGVLLTM